MRNFKEFLEEQKKLKDEEEKFKLLIDKYIKITADKQIRNNYVKCINFRIWSHNINRGEYFIIEYKAAGYSNMTISLDYEEYLDLERFVENPDLYISAKKYNL